MAKKKLTVRLDADLVRKAELVAAKRGTSIDALVARLVEGLVVQDVPYEEARSLAAEIMSSRAVRGRDWRRDELHDR